MYICICNALTDRHVRSAASAGAVSVDEVFRECNCAARCGTCKGFIKKLLVQKPAPDRRDANTLALA